MKIIAIGRNYPQHAAELSHSIPENPIFFIKPDTSILKNNAPFYHPTFSNDIQHEIEVVLKISKEGKNITEKFAEKYFEEISLGIDFTARDIQKKCQTNGLPWEPSKAFDHSAPIGEFIPKDNFLNLKNLNFHLNVNGITKQKGNTNELLFPFEKIIAYVSQYITLKKGDLIFTGTPSGVQKVNINDKLEGYLENKKLLFCEIK